MVKTNIDGNMESIIAKIQKMLNTTTENGATESEAETALLLAQKLMARHSLDVADIEANSNDKETQKEVVEGFGSENVKLPWWYKQLASIIADNFRCYTFIKSYYATSKIAFLGLKVDVEIAKSVFKFATIQIEHYAKEYRRARRKELDKKLPDGFKKGSFEEMSEIAINAGLQKHIVMGIKVTYNTDSTRKKYLTTALKDFLGLSIDGAAIRNDFIRGFLSGLREKFKEQQEQNKEEWGLVLVKDKDVVARFESMTFKTSSASSVRTGNDGDAYSTGRQRGKAFNNVSGELK